MYNNNDHDNGVGKENTEKPASSNVGGDSAPSQEKSSVSGVATGYPSGGYKSGGDGEYVNPWREPIYSPLRENAPGVYSPSHHVTGDYSSRRGRNASGQKKEGTRASRLFFIILLAVVLCAGAGGTAAYLVTDYMLESSGIKDYNQVVLGSDTADTDDEGDGSVTAVPGDTLSGNAIYALGCEQVVGITTSYNTTNAFGQSSSSAVTGSGFIISQDGYIMTNYHVIEYAVTYGYDLSVIFFDGTTYKTEIIGYDRDNDIAVVKIDATGLNAVTFCEEMSVGDTVYAIGNPLGELTYSMTSGIVSALDRVISTDDSTAINMFQFDAAVNSGNSGGPVYNAQGEVIGIATAKYSSSATSSSASIEGIGFAIPISDAVDIASELVENGYVAGKAYLGITVQDVSSSVAEYFNMPEGAYIYSVTTGSCAETAGLKVGDVITAIDGSAVTSVETLKILLKQYAAGDTVTLTVYRSGSDMDVSVVLDENIPEGYGSTANG